MAGRDQGADARGRTRRRDDVCPDRRDAGIDTAKVRELRETAKSITGGGELESDSLIHIFDLKADQLRIRRALPRILPCSPRRNAEATSDLA